MKNFFITILKNSFFRVPFFIFFLLGFLASIWFIRNRVVTLEDKFASSDIYLVKQVVDIDHGGKTTIVVLDNNLAYNLRSNIKADSLLGKSIKIAVHRGEIYRLAVVE